MHTNDDEEEIPTNFASKSSVNSNMFQGNISNYASNPQNKQSQDYNALGSKFNQKQDLDDVNLSVRENNEYRPCSHNESFHPPLVSKQSTNLNNTEQYYEELDLIDAEDDEPQHPNTQPDNDDDDGDTRNIQVPQQNLLNINKEEHNNNFYRSPDFKAPKDFENNQKIQNLISFGEDLTQQLNSNKKQIASGEKQNNTDRVYINPLAEQRIPQNQYSYSPAGKHNMSMDHGLKQANIRRSVEKVERGYNVEYSVNKRKLKPLQSAQYIKTGTNSENRLTQASTNSSQTQTPSNRPPAYKQVSSSEQYSNLLQGRTASNGSKKGMLLPKISKEAHPINGYNSNKIGGSKQKRGRNMSSELKHRLNSGKQKAIRENSFFQSRDESSSRDHRQFQSSVERQSGDIQYVPRRKTNPMTSSAQHSLNDSYDQANQQNPQQFESSQATLVNGIVKTKVTKMSSESYYSEKIASLLDTDIRTKSDKELVSQNQMLRKVMVELQNQIKRIMSKTNGGRDPQSTKRGSPSQKKQQLIEEMRLNDEIILSQEEELQKIERALSKANNVEYLMELNARISQAHDDKKKLDRDRRNLEFLHKKDFYTNLGNPVIPEQIAQKKAIGSMHDKREQVDHLRRQCFNLQQKNQQSLEFITEQTKNMQQWNDRHQKLLSIATHMGLLEDPEQIKKREMMKKRKQDLLKAIEIQNRANQQKEKLNHKGTIQAIQDIEFEQQYNNQLMHEYNGTMKHLQQLENEVQRYQNLQYQNLWDSNMNEYLLRADDEATQNHTEFRVTVSPNIGSVPEFRNEEIVKDWNVRDRKGTGSISSPPFRKKTVDPISEDEEEATSANNSPLNKGEYAGSSKNSPSLQQRAIRKESSSSNNQDMASIKLGNITGRSKKTISSRNASPEIGPMKYTKDSARGHTKGLDSESSQSKEGPIFVDRSQADRLLHDERPSFGQSGLLRDQSALDKKQVSDLTQNNQTYEGYSLGDEQIFSSKEDKRKQTNSVVQYYKSIKADVNLRRMATSKENEENKNIQKRGSILNDNLQGISSSYGKNDHRKFLLESRQRLQKSNESLQGSHQNSNHSFKKQSSMHSQNYSHAQSMHQQHQPQVASQLSSPPHQNKNISEPQSEGKQQYKGRRESHFLDGNALPKRFSTKLSPDQRGGEILVHEDSNLDSQVISSQQQQQSPAQIYQQYYQQQTQYQQSPNQQNKSYQQVQQSPQQSVISNLTSKFKPQEGRSSFINGNQNDFPIIEEEEKTLDNKLDKDDQQTIKRDNSNTNINQRNPPLKIPSMSNNSNSNATATPLTNPTNKDSSRRNRSPQNQLNSAEYRQDKDLAEVNYSPHQQKLPINTQRSFELDQGDILSSHRSGGGLDQQNEPNNPKISIPLNINDTKPLRASIDSNINNKNQLLNSQEISHRGNKFIEEIMQSPQQAQQSFPLHSPPNQGGGTTVMRGVNNTESGSINPLNSNLNSIQTQRFENKVVSPQQDSIATPHNVVAKQDGNIPEPMPPKKFSLVGNQGGGDFDSRPHTIRKSNLRGSVLQMNDGLNLDTEVLTQNPVSNQQNGTDQRKLVLLGSHEGTGQALNTENEFVKTDFLVGQPNKKLGGGGLDIFNFGGEDVGAGNYDMKDMIASPLEPKQPQPPNKQADSAQQHATRGRRMKMNAADPHKKQNALAEKAEQGGNDFFSDLNI